MTPIINLALLFSLYSSCNQNFQGIHSERRFLPLLGRVCPLDSPSLSHLTSRPMSIITIVRGAPIVGSFPHHVSDYAAHYYWDLDPFPFPFFPLHLPGNLPITMLFHSSGCWLPKRVPIPPPLYSASKESRFSKHQIPQASSNGRCSSPFNDDLSLPRGAFISGNSCHLQ